MEPHGIAYDTGSGSWCVQLNLPPTVLEAAQTNDGCDGTTHTIVVLDVSGSMGCSVPRLIKQVLPDSLERAGMHADHTVHLVTFSTEASHLTTTVRLMRANTTVADGGTNLSPAISVLSDLMSRLSTQDRQQAGRHVLSRFHILAVSDGDIFDPTQSMAAAVSLRAHLLDSHWHVQAQAIRFVSSSHANPDTRALASILQLSTEGHARLIDVFASSADSVLVEQFKDMTGLQSRALVVTTTEGSGEEALDAFLPVPWSRTENGNKQLLVHWPRSRLRENLTVSFWMSALCWHPEMGPLYLNHSLPVPVVVKPLTWSAYASVLSNSGETLLTTAALLRVVNHEDTLTELRKMVPFFEQMERTVQSDPGGDEPIEDAGESRRRDVILHRRVLALRKKVQKAQTALATQLNQIANETRLDSFNSQQKADYLRTVGANRKTAKGLVRRAATSADPDDIVRKEAAAVALHLAELEAALSGGAEGELPVSFINQANVLDGLRAIADLARSQDDDADGELPNGTEVDQVERMAQAMNGVDAIDFLELLNLVGIPAISLRVGDYPNPYLYRVDRLHHGFFLSLSDCISFDRLSATAGTANALGHDGEAVGPNLSWRGVSIPGVDHGVVTDVIAVVEHPAIGAFLRKWAPQLWSLTAGIGMRRVLACVPQTAAAATTAGLLCAIRSFHVAEGTSVALRSVRMLVATALMSRSMASMKEEMGLITSAANTSADRLCRVEQQPTEGQWLIPLLAAFRQLHTQRVSSGHEQLTGASWWETTLTGHAALPAATQKFLRSWLAYHVFRHVQQHFRHSGGDGEAAKLVAAHLTELLGVTAEVEAAQRTEWPRSELFTFEMPAKKETEGVPTATAPLSPVIANSADLLRIFGLEVVSGRGVAIAEQNTSRMQALYMRTKTLLDDLLVQVVYLWLGADFMDNSEDAAEAAAKYVRAQCETDSDAFYACVLTRFLGIDALSAAVTTPTGSRVSTGLALRLDVHLAVLALALLYPTMESRLVTVTGGADGADSQTSPVPDYADLGVVHTLLAEKRVSAMVTARRQVALTKHKAEQVWLAKQLVQRLCVLPMTESVPYWQNGLYYLRDATISSQSPPEAQQAQREAAQVRPFYHVCLTDPSHVGVGLLSRALLCGTYQEAPDAPIEAVVDVAEKIAALLTGRLFPPLSTVTDQTEMVEAEKLPILWNNGSDWMGIKLGPYRDAVALRSPMGMEAWQRIVLVYRSQFQHRYKRGDIENRHTHSARKPSYFAMGYASLEDYAAGVSAEEWARYCTAHSHCCGLQGYTVAQNTRRQQEVVRELEAAHQRRRAKKRARCDARDERKRRQREEEEHDAIKRTRQN